ncbi:MAG TPA: transporter [Bacteroidota bacterium]|nr:transporter [Bacteroidota bacterium]
MRFSAQCQDNYEIQVYGSETVAPGRTMIELHSNFTPEGSRIASEGVIPSQNTFHETLEITEGISPSFELGWYLFTSTVRGGGPDWVGTHLRPRVRVPEQWQLPIGASLSAEFGYQRRIFSEDTWSLELRPIFDKQIGGLYVSVNPTLEKSLRGATSSQGFQFSPNVKVSYDVTPLITLGAEYYGSLGPVFGFYPAPEQQHQIFPSLDLNFSPDWEFNFGVGFGLTDSTDRSIIKMILGRRLSL